MIMRRLLACVFALLVPACGPCRRAPEEVKTDDAIADDFRRDSATFEHLRDMILEEEACDGVWIDHYEWTDACNVGACTGAPPPPKTGSPPGVSDRACEYPSGCGRWNGEEPTADILASICRISRSRAQVYIDGLHAVGALRIERARKDPRPVEMQDHVADDVSFIIQYFGIIPSGSETDVVYRTSAPPKMKEGTTAKGFDYVPLSKPGWYLRHEWN